MGFIEDELSEFKGLCERVVPGTKLVSCVRSMVRAEIRKTDFKHIVVCIQFTDNYPNTPLLVELKSKTLSEKLLQKLTNVCEQEIKKYLGKAQILTTIKFLRNFIDENPLCCCYDEISQIKRLIGGGDELKLKQKFSCLGVNVFKDKYFLKCKIEVPDDYPLKAIDFSAIQTNFTPVFHKHIVCQAKEIARRCVEPPIKKKPNDPPFKPQPSLLKVVDFLIDCVKRLPTENCQYCKKICFPSDPEQLDFNENSPKHIERILCGHLFHQECFFTYMKTPPFGNKKCSGCGKKVSHFKWSVSDRLAENRWAHEQARERELQEVQDFFN